MTIRLCMITSMVINATCLPPSNREQFGNRIAKFPLWELHPWEQLTSNPPTPFDSEPLAKQSAFTVLTYHNKHKCNILLPLGTHFCNVVKHILSQKVDTNPK